MAKRVVLHIGAMKSGTSFIQNVLHRNREVLMERDLRFAMDRWKQQVQAARDLAGSGGEDQPPLAPDGPWQRLVDDVHAWPGTSVVSMEFFGPQNSHKVEIVAEAFAGADLQVVLTARDLARSLPAMWTESMQNRGVRTWEEFLTAVRNEDLSNPAGRNFWRHQRISKVAATWAGVVGRDHFTLITVPPKGSPPSVLWDRFCAVAGIPVGLCDLDVRSNPQLDAAAAMLLRRINVELAEAGFDKPQYERVVKGILAKQGLVGRAREHPPLGVDERWVRRRSKEEVARIRALDLRVVGDLDELQGTRVEGVHTKDVSTEDELHAAVDALVFLLRRIMDRPQPAQSAQPAPAVQATSTEGSR